MMKLSRLTDRIIEKSTATQGAPIDPWAVHTLATQRVKAGESITLLSIGQEVHEYTPGLVVDAAVSSLRAGRHHYADIRGDQSLRAAIADYHHRLTAQQVSPEAVCVFAGAQNALFSLAQVLLEPGDEVILVAPYYTTYQATFAASGATVVTVQVDEQNHYQLDEQKILDAVSPDTQLIVLNAPNNPLGSRYSGAQLECIVSACIKNDIWLVMDAVYLDIINPDTIDLPHAIPGAADRLITVGSLSKSHRMTGWRIGWAVVPEALSEPLYNLCVCMHYGLPPFIQDAAQVAIVQCSNTPLAVRSVMDARRGIAVEQLSACKPARLIDPEQGMFILLDVAPLQMTAFEFAMALLEQESVSVLPCDGFGPGGRFLVRIGLCVDGEELADACRKINRFIHAFSSHQ